MTAGGRIAAVATAALAALAIGAASRAPWAASPEDRALLRLSWRAPSEVAEQCRPLSAQEKADLPVHMQVPEVCETRAVPYLLEVRIDGATFAADTIHGAGAREDRPITVFREIPVAVGERAIDIAFRRWRRSRTRTRTLKAIPPNAGTMATKGTTEMRTKGTTEMRTTTIRSRSRTRSR